MGNKKMNINEELENSDKISEKKATGRKAIKEKLVQAVREGDIEKQNRYRNQLKGSK